MALLPGGASVETTQAPPPSGGNGPPRKPCPPANELIDRAIAVLLEIAEDTTQMGTSRVGAARTLVEIATRGKVGGTDLDRLTDEELDAKARELAKRVLGMGAGGAAGDRKGGG